MLSCWNCTGVQHMNHEHRGICLARLVWMGSDLSQDSARKANTCHKHIGMPFRPEGGKSESLLGGHLVTALKFLSFCCWLRFFLLTYWFCSLEDHSTLSPLLVVPRSSWSAPATVFRRGYLAAHRKKPGTIVGARWNRLERIDRRKNILYCLYIYIYMTDFFKVFVWFRVSLSQ